jgi:mRNA-degrading endonuclease toxin of MazEF toxin-antitoxin module
MITTGSVVVARFPYLDDSSQSKVRCGVVISDEQYHDLFERRRFILAFISSVVPNEILDGWEFVIEEGTELFKNSGLRKRSVIKAHRIVALQEEEIMQHIGQLPLSLVEEIRKKAIKRMFGL